MRTRASAQCRDEVVVSAVCNQGTAAEINAIAKVSADCNCLSVKRNNPMELESRCREYTIPLIDTVCRQLYDEQAQRIGASSAPEVNRTLKGTSNVDIP